MMNKFLLSGSFWMAIMVAGCVLWASTVLAASGGGDGPKVVTLKPDFVAEGQGKNVDSIGFWEAPDPADTLIFVSAKDNQLVEVWKYPFACNEQVPPVQVSPVILAAPAYNGYATEPCSTPKRPKVALP